MIITTTNSVEGHTVSDYLCVVSSHVVAGTGLFSDISAGFSDIFGGRSGSYQKQVSSIYNEAIRGLVEKATGMRAGGVVGVSVDVDEISGGGKSMLMVTATGTAVRFEAAGPSVEDAEEGAVGYEELNAEAHIRQLASGNPETVLSPSNVEFLVMKRDPSILPRLVETVRLMSERYASSQEAFNANEAVRAAAQVFDSLPTPHVEGAIREGYRTAQGPAVLFYHERLAHHRAGSLITAMEWLRDPELAVRKRAINVALLPRTYSAADEDVLRTLSATMPDAFPDIWVEEERSGLMGKKRVTRCTACETTFEDEPGRCPGCKLDRHGFAAGQMTPKEASSHFLLRADALAVVLGRSLNGVDDRAGVPSD